MGCKKYLINDISLIYNSERRKGSQILILLNKGDNYGKH